MSSGRGGHCTETSRAGQGICTYSKESDKDMAVPFWQQQAMNMNATEACKTGRTIREIAWQLVYQERNKQKQDFIIQHERGGKQDRLHVQKRET